MRDLTRFDAVVTRPGYVRTSEGEVRCDAAASLAVGSQVVVTIESGSQGEHAVLAGGAASFDNSRLVGNAWLPRRGELY